MPLAVELPQNFCENLVRLLEYSRRQIQPFLDKRLDILRQVLGRHYSNGGCKERVPLPFLRMQTNILSHEVISRSPRCLVEAKDPRLRPVARGTQQWADENFEAQNLEREMQFWGLEAILYPIGMCKICVDYEESQDGQGADLMIPRVEHIDAERACWDMTATDWTQLDFIGHRGTWPKTDLQGEGFDEAYVATLQPDLQTHINERGGEKTESLSVVEPYNVNRLRDYIDCWELYLPREGLEVTFPVVGNTISHRPVRVKEYIGPKTDINCGNFHPLGYDPVPGNLMPSPVVHAIYDLTEIANIVVRKLLRQAQRQKTNLLVQQTSLDEGKNLINLSDGQAMGVTHPEAFKEFRWGGPDQQNMAFAQYAKQQISWFGGNFDAVAGLGPQSPTARQDELLNAASSKPIQFMQQEFQGRTRELMRSVLWYEWHSRRVMNYQMPIEGMPGAALPWQVTPQERYGGGDSKFGRLQFSVHPYSMRAMSPEKRFQQWMTLFTQIILPSAPMLQQMGYGVDVAAMVKKLARLWDINDLDEVLKAMMPPQAQPGQQGADPLSQNEGVRLRPPGTGQYTRTNVSANTPEGQDQEIMRLMNTGGAVNGGGGQAA